MILAVCYPCLLVLALLSDAVPFIAGSMVTANAVVRHPVWLLLLLLWLPAAAELLKLLKQLLKVVPQRSEAQ
jgi:hypothetical protein